MISSLRWQQPDNISAYDSSLKQQIFAVRSASVSIQGQVFSKENENGLPEV